MRAVRLAVPVILTFAVLNACGDDPGGGTKSDASVDHTADGAGGLGGSAASGGSVGIGGTGGVVAGGGAGTCLLYTSPSPRDS